MNYHATLLAARFGAVATMDYEPELRVMLICPISEKEQIASPLRYQVWHGVVIADDPTNHHAWPIGELITLAPGASGVVIIPETP
jgi:hypothetical protein